MTRQKGRKKGNNVKNKVPKKLLASKLENFLFAAYMANSSEFHIQRKIFLCAQSHRVIIWYCRNHFPFEFFMFFASHVLDKSQMTKTKVHHTHVFCYFLIVSATKRRTLIHTALIFCCRIYLLVIVDVVDVLHCVK